MANKGTPFEREICRRLSLWWTDGERDDVFWRTSGSGGRATNRRKQEKKTKYEYGDVTFTDPIGKPLIDFFLIELKRGYTKNISLLDLIDKSKDAKTPLLLQWWQKAEEEKKFAERKYSIIIFRRDRREALMFMNALLYNFLEQYCGEFNRKIIGIKNKENIFMIILFKDFLDWVSPATFNNN